MSKNLSDLFPPGGGVDGYDDTQIKDDLAKEVEDRKDGDQLLQDQIDAIPDSAGMVIQPTEPTDPVTGLQWMDSTTGRIWIWDEDKWLEFPAGGSADAGGGGGGGATAAGGAGAGPTAAQGPGGAGATTNINSSPTTFAGGGGGGGWSSPSAGGAAGSGGGGKGGDPASGPGPISGTAGTANTGGGGGGGHACSAATGGAGGSGIVIIRYKFQ